MRGTALAIGMQDTADVPSTTEAPIDVDDSTSDATALDGASDRGCSCRTQRHESPLTLRLAVLARPRRRRA